MARISNFLTAASFTIATTVVNGRLSILMGVSVKKRPDGSIPEPRLKCPGGCGEDVDTEWANLFNTILPSGTQKTDEELILRLSQIGIPGVRPGVISNDIVAAAAGHREFFAETGNALPDISQLILQNPQATNKIARGTKEQRWQVALIDHELFTLNAERAEASEMLPFSWISLEDILSGYSGGMKLNPMHWSATVKCIDLLYTVLKGANVPGCDSCIPATVRAIEEALAYGLRNHKTLAGLAARIDSDIRDRII